MVTADKLAAIRTKAEALAGQGLGEDADTLVGLAAHAACAYCQRTDIPEEMEQAVAALVVSGALGGEGNVKSVTRGDTSIAYAVDSGASGGVWDRLAPFRRLGRLRREG